MQVKLATTFTLTLVAALAGAAYAGPQSATDEAAESLGEIAGQLQSLREHAADRWASYAPEVAACDAAVKKARAAGLADDTKLFHWGFGELDEAHFQDQKAFLTLGEASRLCADYASWRKVVPAAHVLEEARKTIDTMAMVEPLSWGAYVADQWAEQSRACSKAVNDALADGVPADRKTKIVDVELTLGEGERQVCQKLLEASKSVGAQIAAAHAADLAKRSEPWKQAGFTGDRLRLMVEDDLIDWMTKGCQRVEDKKFLKKAAVLFQWWETDDGVITIRRFQFKGDKLVRTTEKSYSLREHAYRGCK